MKVVTSNRVLLRPVNSDVLYRSSNSILDNSYECLKYPMMSGENIYRYTFSTKGWVPLRTARISKLQVVESGVRGKMPLESVCVWV